MVLTRKTLIAGRYIPHPTMMYRHSRYANRLIAKIIVWLMAEILLTFLGLDDLADYSEFVYERPISVLIGQTK